MNHLAHALIAVQSGTSLVGNLMGDFVKGRPELLYEGDVLWGIRAHRTVDAFVDAHAAFARSRARFPTSLRRWSGILVDLGYDHALARCWDELGNGTLRDFADDVYAQLRAAADTLPEEMHGFVEYMTSTDLLAAYAEPAGITRALTGMSRRMRRANPLAEAAPFVLEVAAGLEEDLRELLPQTIAAVRAADGSRLVSYYSQRANEYDRIYEKPERQSDLTALRKTVSGWLRGRSVLELACGTGYWTRVAAESARSIVATDASDAVLPLARRREFTGAAVEFRQADAYAPDAIDGEFDAILAAFWVSHVPRQRLEAFVSSLSRRLWRGGRVVLLDNRFVEGSNTPISRRDADGDSWQVRRLADGETHEIRKNFFERGEILDVLEAVSGSVELRELTYFWAACVETPASSDEKPLRVSG